MIKKTLFFGNPVYLSTANDQMVIAFPDKAKEKRIIAVEDIGMGPSSRATNNICLPDC